MERGDRLTRRRLVGLVAATAALAGCGGPGGEDVEGEDGAEEPPQRPVTETATEPDDPPPNESAGGHPNDLENQTPGYERGSQTDAETANETAGPGEESAGE